MNTGTYTGPHLIEHNERIRINSKPLAKRLFAKYFFEVYDMLGLANMDESRPPRYLQLLCLTSFHAFASEGVNFAIYEAHRGGEYDATNIIRRPCVTGITSIGMDHILQLGPTLDNIAWHKGGIFKYGARAFSAPQTHVVTKVLEDRAASKGVTLEFVTANSGLTITAHPPVQHLNCSLAVRICNEALATRQLGPLSDNDIVEAVQNFEWPGRFQVIETTICKWFLDGAHNDLSIGCAAEWFTSASMLDRYVFAHQAPYLLKFFQ